MDSRHNTMKTDLTTGGALRNFRDVGYSINTILAGHVCIPGMLYRSGAIQAGSQVHHLPLRSILNRRREPDPNCGHIHTIHVAPSASMNNYTVTSAVFHEWIQRVCATVTAATVWPLLIHCTAGKDLTGVGYCPALKKSGHS